MNINYIDPLSKALSHMRNALFNPFNLNKWLILGFTAFLAGLLDGPDGKGGGNDNNGNDFHLRDIAEFPYYAWDWLTENPGWFMLIAFGVFVIAAVIVLLTWISSRGKFMFLDNVVQNRAEIVKPWHEFKEQGNSLFLWRLGFGFVCLATFLFAVFLFFLFAGIINDGYLPRRLPVISIAGFVLLFISLLVSIGYVSMFLNNFVVPLMYKNRIKTNQAWNIFLSLLTRYFFYFILYGLVLIVLYIFVFIGVITLALFTCCIGLILIIIPYVGSVILLPISYTFQAYCLEFLQQFGPEYKIFPEQYEESEDIQTV